MATNEFDPVSREELIKRAAPKKSALQIHKEEQEAKKQQRIEEENQERILRNRGTSLAREREREKARAKAEADRAKYEADLAAYNEQQRQIQRGELVRNLPVDSDLAEFGAASTAPGLMLTRPDKPIEAAIEPVRSKYQSRPEWIWDPERDTEFEGDIGGERYTRYVTEVLREDPVRSFGKVEGEYDPGIPEIAYEGKPNEFTQTISTEFGPYQFRTYRPELGTAAGYFEEAGLDHPIYTDETWLGRDQFEPHTAYDPGWIYTGSQAGIIRDTIDWDLLEYDVPQAAMMARTEYQEARAAEFPDIILPDKSMTPRDPRHTQRDTYTVRGYEVDRDLFRDVDPIDAALELDELSEYEFDNIDFRVARDDFRGGFTDGSMSPGERTAKAIQSGRGSAPDYLTQFDKDLELEFGSGYESRWDPNKIDPEFRKAFNELKKGGKGRIVGSTVETAWNLVPNALYGAYMAPTISKQQWKQVIKELDPIGDAQSRYAQDPYGFYGDVAGSLIGFTGGVAAISKLPGVAGKTLPRPIVWMVQPDEEVLTMLGSKAFPDFTKRIGGTFDWEEATAMAVKKQLDRTKATFRKTTIRGVELQREVNELKKLQKRTSNDERGMLKNKLIQEKIRRTNAEIEYEKETEALRRAGVETDVEADIRRINFETDLEYFELDSELEAMELDLEYDSELEYRPEMEYEGEFEGEVEAEMEMEMEMEMELEMEMEMEMEMELEAELEAEIEAEIEAEMEIEPELEIELDFDEDDVVKRKRMPFQLFPKTVKFERYAAVKTKLDDDIENLLRGL
tara:strand:- start:974 stop:3355 length:2382 start_codon:yes stop_codon:yes gene_type:complete